MELVGGTGGGLVDTPEGQRTGLWGVPGNVHNYIRLSSVESYSVPFVWTGRAKTTKNYGPDAKFVPGGQTVWYNPAFVFFPQYGTDATDCDGNNENVLIGLNDNKVGISAELRCERPDQAYGVRTGYESRTRGDPGVVWDDQWHDFRVEVHSHEHYTVYWDDVLMADVIEESPATIKPGRVKVGIRLDFCDVTLTDLNLVEETMTEFVPIYFLAKMYREAGLTVNILAGAERRGARMYSSGYENADVRGLDQHHTAQPTHVSDIQSIAYMTFNAPYPVICNVYPHKDDPGTLTICAAGPSYTAGKGGALGTVPRDRGNKYYWSTEAPNNGVGEPWPDHLQKTMVTMAAVEVQFFSNWGPGWPERDHFVKGRIPAHFEWTPGRKIDPFGPSRYTDYQNQMWNMYTFRRDVANRHAELYDTPTPPQEDDDMPKICAQSRIDSRDAAFHKTLQAGEKREVWLTLPAGAVAAVINVVILPKATTTRGWVSVGGLVPTPSSPGTTINWSAGNTIAQDQMTVLITEGKKIHLQGNSDCEFVIDVTGLYW